MSRWVLARLLGVSWRVGGTVFVAQWQRARVGALMAYSCRAARRIQRPLSAATLVSVAGRFFPTGIHRQDTIAVLFRTCCTVAHSGQR
jgi:hypothetical protein